MAEVPEKAPEKKPERRKARSGAGTDRVDALLMLLIALFMGSVLLLQYNRPLVTSTLDRIFGRPQPAFTIPTTTLAAPLEMTTTTAAAPAIKLPREYRGIKFFTSFAVAKPFILRQYKPVPKDQKKKAERWRLEEDGSRIEGARRNMTLEYMGDPASGNPRYLTFYFHEYKFVGAVEYYLKVDPDILLAKFISEFGACTSKDVYKDKLDRYIWDNGQLRIYFLANRPKNAAVFDFQMKKYATEP